MKLLNVSIFYTLRTLDWTVYLKVDNQSRFFLREGGEGGVEGESGSLSILNKNFFSALF